MKKFVFTALLVFATLFGVQCSGLSTVSNIAEARDVWVANDSGGDFYVITETFQKRKHGWFNFDVTVKLVVPGHPVGDPSGNYRYSFSYSSGEWIYTMSEMDDWQSAENWIVTRNILHYCLNNLM